MYESPICLFMQEITTTMENERENTITAKISESIGVDIDKGELIKALQYDRQQYNKGYADAKAMYESLLDKIRADIEFLANSMAGHTGMVCAEDVFAIIDIYRKEE